MNEKRTVRYVDHYLPDSSVIEEVYLTDTGDVYVVFKHSGRVAGYRDVGRWVFDNLLRSSSVGRYYNAYVKDRFQGLDGNVTFVPASDRVAPTVASTHNVIANPTVSTETQELSRFEVVYDLAGSEVIFPVNAVDEQAALHASSEHVSKFTGLDFVMTKVIHYFD
jgi:hypothetical protein